MKEKKGLSDKELGAKYEAGAIDMSKVIKASMKDYKPIPRIVTDRVKRNK
jgi:hypothetical protein